MKKWLILFAIVDLVFVGLVLMKSTSNQRNIATYSDPLYSELNTGQKNKFDFVKSFQFLADSTNLIFETDRLQSLCQSNSIIELKFQALNVAYAGTHPTISHLYSCELIRKDISGTKLYTTMKDFYSMHTTSYLKLVDGELRANQVYSDEEFPSEWSLSEVIVTGESNFSVSNVEMNTVHTDHRFEFSVAISSK